MDQKPRILRNKVRPTLEGLGWLAVSLLLLYQGWLRSINLVALLAAFLLSLWIVNYYWVWRRFRLKRLRVQRRVNEPVFARETFTTTLEATNPTVEPQPSLRIADEGPFHRHVFATPLLKPGETQGHAIQVTLPRRGEYVWPTLNVSTGHPFGLIRRTIELATGETVLVLPRLGRVHHGRLRSLLLQQPHVTQSTKRPVLRHPGAQTEFYGLREFRTGDSPRWIHWRTTARIGELMVREFEEPPVDNLVVLVDAWLPEPVRDLNKKLAQVRAENQNVIRQLLKSGPAPPPHVRHLKEQALARKEDPHRIPLERLEFALSLAATVCWEWCRQPGAKVGLGIADAGGSFATVETGQRQVFPLLESLARIQGGPTPNHAELIKELGMASIPAGPALLITTRSSVDDGPLAERLRRPIFTLDVTQDSVADVFQEVKQSTRPATMAGATQSKRAAVRG